MILTQRNSRKPTYYQGMISMSILPQTINQSTQVSHPLTWLLERSK